MAENQTSAKDKLKRITIDGNTVERFSKKECAEGECAQLELEQKCRQVRKCRFPIKFFSCRTPRRSRRGCKC